MHFTLVTAILNGDDLNNFSEKVSDFLFLGKHGDATMSISTSSPGYYSSVNADL